MAHPKLSVSIAGNAQGSGIGGDWYCAGLWHRRRLVLRRAVVSEEIGNVQDWYRRRLAMRRALVSEEIGNAQGSYIGGDRQYAGLLQRRNDVSNTHQPPHIFLRSMKIKGSIEAIYSAVTICHR